MPSSLRSGGWLLGYLLLALAPLALSLVQLDPGRGFWVNLSVATGFVGLSLMGLQFLLAARWARVTNPFGFDAVLQYHRQVTYLAFLLIIAHPLILFVWDTRFLSLLDVPAAPLRARFAVGSVALLIVLVVTSVWRRRLGLGYAMWQAVHSILAVLIVATALAHVLLIGYYVDQPWERALWVAYTAVFVWIGIWVRVIKPLQRRRRRWRVVSVTPEAGHSATVSLELVNTGSYGPEGFRFEPGQFAWIHTGSSPFALAYHPFSFSSSAERPELVSFTIKAAGGFSTAAGELGVGHTVYLDGPWGSFHLDGGATPGYVFIAGGIGVTPMLSMLRTLADRGDRRPCWLLLGNRDRASITCADELAALRDRLDLTLVHVLSSGADDPGWDGEVGRIDAPLLERVLPTERARLAYFLCGAEPMMDAVEAALIRLEVPPDRVNAERFAMA
ncbi:MAG TPA: ferric reductase-like transmembrane domain-containing protein [Candidatus Nanopelagicales bacterium]|jgi:predicted ferric reductase|nr:ferric reductase-like transmembrane domain-containing protein [Candidatus Nanopelagicales bacterium]